MRPEPFRGYYPQLAVLLTLSFLTSLISSCSFQFFSLIVFLVPVASLPLSRSPCLSLLSIFVCLVSERCEKQLGPSGRGKREKVGTKG